jgi:hypothetical protein
MADALLRGHIRVENAFRDTGQLQLDLPSCSASAAAIPG